MTACPSCGSPRLTLLAYNRRGRRWRCGRCGAVWQEDYR